MKIHGVVEQLDVNNSYQGSICSDVNLSGWRINNGNLSGWMLDDVNLSNSRVQNANLSGLKLENCRMSEVTIDGIPLEDLLPAYKASHATADGKFK